ncbi:MAG TPA: hypothetical protein VNW47_14425 [Terriglobales bacterium]|nr:hypothetical protein [Terriglobales bacterium]
MKCTTKSAILAALLATLVMSTGAQNQASSQNQAPAHEKKSRHSNVAHKPQKTAPARSAKATRGEAASLETKEADLNSAAPDTRDDNRGRLTSAHPHSTFHAVNKNQHHAATLKTGQLTTSQRPHLDTKQTALHRAIHSDQKQDRKLTPDEASAAPTVHLKKHNARMF